MTGFDGATWELLNALIERGAMPRLKELKSEGVSGALRSTDPPVTGPAWVTVATGVGPGRHGVFDFTLPKEELFHREPAATHHIRVKTVYEHLRPAVLLNLPVTYPPLTGDPTVTSLMTRGPSPIFPPVLRERPWSGAYRVVPDTSLLRAGNVEAYLRDVRALERARFDALKDLWDREDWRLFMAVFSGSDWASHAAYGTLLGKPGECREGEALFGDLDGYLGWIADHMEKDDHLLLVSDHGFAEKKGFFLINEWLIREGWARQRPITALPGNVHAFDAALHAEDGKVGKSPPGVTVERCKTPGLRGRLWRRWYRGRYEHWDPRLELDPLETLALAPSAEQRGVYVNDRKRFSAGTVAPEERAGVASAIVQRLREARDPNGDALCEWVRSGCDLYTGPVASRGPDLLFNTPDWECSATLSLYHLDLFQPGGVGGHDPMGIILAVGKGIPGGSVAGMTLADIAPVLMHWAGESVPGHMEGRVPDELALGRSPGTAPPWTSPRRSRAQEEGCEVAERLRSLGYLG